MRDINLQLRRAYYDLLKGNVNIGGQPVPIYYMFVPQNYPTAYILVQSINSTGRESKNDQDRDTTIQFLISTRSVLNDGSAADSIADQLLNLVYPDRASVMAGCQNMELVSDIAMADYDPQAKVQIIERNIIFSHIISS